MDCTETRARLRSLAGRSSAPLPPASVSADFRRAAVLLLVGCHDGPPCIVLTERSARMRAHSGEVALPGGRIDPGETPERAAVREAVEEVGVDPDAVALFGRLDEAWSKARNHVVPVVDAGCGAGVPVTRHLVAAGFATVGLDFSVAQLELARGLVPGADPVHGDLAGLPFPDSSFDAVVSYYAIIHVPRSEHAAVFAEVWRVLRPGGLALLCVGASDLPEDHDPESWPEHRCTGATSTRRPTGSWCATRGWRSSATR